MSGFHPLEMFGLTPRTKWLVENGNYDYKGRDETRLFKAYSEPLPWKVFGPGFEQGPSFATHAEAITYVAQKVAIAAAEATP